MRLNFLKFFPWDHDFVQYINQSEVAFSRFQPNRRKDKKIVFRADRLAAFGKKIMIDSKNLERTIPCFLEQLHKYQASFGSSVNVAVFS